MTAPARATLLVLGILISMQFTAAFHPASSLTHQSATATTRALFARGGSDEEYDSEYDSEEEDEPIVKKTKALASSTKSKILKSKNVSVKSAAANAMAKSKPVATSGGIGKLYKRMVPHIIRVCLNPFTFVRMSRAYFASLLDINYMKEVSVSFVLEKMFGRGKVVLEKHFLVASNLIVQIYCFVAVFALITANLYLMQKQISEPVQCILH